MGQQQPAGSAADLPSKNGFFMVHLVPMKQQSLFSEPTPLKVQSESRAVAGLNAAQLEAVTTTQGPILVIAGAGTGKTRTLVHRMAYLVEQGVAPDSILLLTFTRKASQEMLSRASLLMEESCQQVTGGTFHGVANLLLRRYGHHLGYPSHFSILDQGDAQGIVNLLKSSLEIGGAGRRFPSKRAVINMISGAVNKNLDFEEYVEDRYFHLIEFRDDLCLIRKHYQEFKKDHALMDYDDLLVNFRNVLRDVPEVRAEVAARFQYVMVDEYQDTNRMQAEIVKLIGGGHTNVMVVGDDAQSIYSFRGADFQNIMEFPDIFPSTKIVRLEENYRSVQPILEATNAIIGGAVEKYAKTLFSQIESEDKPVLHKPRDENGQARYVVEKIIKFQKEGVPLTEMAVLFRSGFHSYKLELELANQGIPFEKRGGMKLTESAHIKDVLAYLKIQCNPADRLSWNRILLHLDKVGPKTAEKMLATLGDGDDPIHILANYKAGNTSKAGLAKLVTALGDLQRITNPGGKLACVLDYYQPIFERIYADDYPSRSRDLDQLRDLLGGYESLQKFIDDAVLDPPADASKGDLGDEKLILSTVHSSKGLEWQKVFLLNLVEGKFPSGQAQLPAEREEERRLLYVAATRAKDHLFMIAPRMTIGHDRMMQSSVTSEFVEDISISLLDGGVDYGMYVPPVPKFSKPVERDIGNAEKSLAAFTTGAVVQHNFFGKGKVIKTVPPKTVEIFFHRHGLKKLHLDYAKLELVTA
jgi:DNA helicase-2/ATP-dependent DNA helicase PcrA